MDKVTLCALNMRCRRAQKPVRPRSCPEGEQMLVVNKTVKPQLAELKKTARWKTLTVLREGPSAHHQTLLSA